MGFLRKYREEFRAEVEAMRDPRAVRGCLGALAAHKGAAQLELVTITNVDVLGRKDIIREQAGVAVASINRALDAEYPDCSGRLYLEENGTVLLRCGANDCLLPRSNQS